MTAIFHIDAFADAPFKGNPAAVCLLDAPRNDPWMQAMAAEMNLSETAFVLAEADGYRLRWFTPATEVNLCGHATLASAHALWQSGLLAPDATARFHTRSGLLLVDQTDGAIRMRFPAIDNAPCEPPAGLLPAMGIDADDVRACGNKHLIRVASETTVREMKPDFAALRELPLRGVMVTAQADAGSNLDFVSRYFAPWVGINEDPVTGSAHCCLAPYWRERLDKAELMAYQASARGGVLRLVVKAEEVEIYGQAVTVYRGELAV